MNVVFLGNHSLSLANWISYWMLMQGSYVPHANSSLPSAQSLTPSQTRFRFTHSPFWHLAWSALQGENGKGGRGPSTAADVVVVVAGVVKAGTVALSKSRTNLWLNLAIPRGVSMNDRGARQTSRTPSWTRMKPLTTVELITHVSTVQSVVTQVFFQDACFITTLELISHTRSSGRDYYETRRGKEGRGGSWRIKNMQANNTCCQYNTLMSSQSTNHTQADENQAHSTSGTTQARCKASRWSLIFTIKCFKLQILP